MTEEAVESGGSGPSRLPAVAILALVGVVLVLGIRGCGGQISDYLARCPDDASKISLDDGGFLCELPDGTAHGPFRRRYADGRIAEKGEYREGLKNGRFESWHADGSRATSGEFRDDKHWGTWTEWYPNGVEKIVRAYEDGVPVGVHRQRAENGAVLHEEEYESGQRVRETRWAENGTQIEYATWTEGVQMLRQRWTDTGTLVYEEEGIHGPKGRIKRWNDAGVLLNQTEFALGYPTERNDYYEDGGVRVARSYGEAGRVMHYAEFDGSGAKVRQLLYDENVAATGSLSDHEGTVGLEVQVAEQLVVSRVIPSGPAAAGGLQVGDVIASIDGWTPPSEVGVVEVLNRLDGMVGTACSLLLLSAGAEEARAVELDRIDRDLLDPRRLRADRWSVAGSRVEEQHFKKGILVRDRQWYDSGEKRRSSDYDDGGRLVWTRAWAENAQLAEEIAPVSGDTHLLWQTWSDEGALQSRGMLLWGRTDQRGRLLKDGSFSHWHAPDVLKSVVEWKEGKKEGAFLANYRSGDLKEKGQFKADQRVGKWSFHSMPVPIDPAIPTSTLASTQIYVEGRKTGAYVKYDGQCDWWIEKGSYRDDQLHGEWQSRPRPRYYTCDPSGMTTRGTWSSRNRAEVCTQGTYREGKKYGVWKAKRDCWCDAADGPCEVREIKYGPEEAVIYDKVSGAP